MLVNLNMIEAVVSRSSYSLTRRLNDLHIFNPKICDLNICQQVANRKPGVGVGMLRGAGDSLDTKTFLGFEVSKFQHLKVSKLQRFKVPNF